jgi:hypothetical protein
MNVRFDVPRHVEVNNVRNTLDIETTGLKRGVVVKERKEK